MKILHTADWHIGLQKDGIIDLETNINSRIIETFQNIDVIIQSAIEEEVNLMIIAGDLFHNSNPSLVYEKMLIERLLRLEEKKIPVKIIPGNHDVNKSITDRYSLMALKSYPWKYIDIITSPKIEKIDSYNFIYLPYNSFLSQTPNTGKNILVGHFTIAGAISGAESFFVSEDGIATRISKNIFFYLMGHIHKPQFFKNVIYPGSIIRINLNERNESKGFYLIENFENFKFIELPYTKNYKLVELDREPIESDFKDITKNDIVRVQLKNIFSKNTYNKVVDFLYNRAHNFDIEVINKKSQLSNYVLQNNKSPKDAFLEYLEKNKEEIKFFEEVKEKGLQFLSEVLDETQEDKTT